MSSGDLDVFSALVQQQNEERTRAREENDKRVEVILAHMGELRQRDFLEKTYNQMMGINPDAEKLREFFEAQEKERRVKDSHDLQIMLGTLPRYV